MTFWQLLHYALSLSPAHACEVVTESTHSTPGTQNPIVYGGSCIQSLLYVLTAPARDLAWVIS